MLYVIVFSFIYILIVTAEINLEIVKNEDGYKTPVLSLVKSESKTNFSLTCTISGSKTRKQFDNHTIWGRRTEKLKFSNLYLVENQIAVTDLNFIDASLKDEGEYFCASPKYKLFKTVYVTIIPKVASIWKKKNKFKRSNYGSGSRGSLNDVDSYDDNENNQHVIYVSESPTDSIYFIFYMIIIVLFTLILIIYFVIKCCLTYDPATTNTTRNRVVKRHNRNRFSHCSSTNNSAALSSTDRYSNTSNIQNDDDRIMHDLNLPHVGQLNSHGFGTRIVVVDDCGMPPSYEEVTNCTHRDEDGLGTRILKLHNGRRIFYEEATASTSIRDNSEGCSTYDNGHDNSDNCGNCVDASNDCSGGGDTSYDCSGGGYSCYDCSGNTSH